MRFSSRTAVVTGAGRGIGRAIASRLASEGASVILNDILPVETLESVADTCRELGGDGVVAAGDISDPETAEQLVDLANERFGRLDIVVNNAFWGRPGAFLASTIDDWAKTIDVSLTGPMLLSRAALPWLIRSGGGSIINVASIHSFGAGRRYAAYEAAKTGLVGLTRAVAAEFGRQGVRCNAVCPGLVVAERNANWWPAERIEWVKSAYPAGRIGTVDDVSAAVAFLASEDASFINGVCLPVDGGLTAILAEVPALELYDSWKASSGS
jgi:NAD(P)-dependent dehydrogenase (short-subunit alcohol dehydrogenase family)